MPIFLHSTRRKVLGALALAVICIFGGAPTEIAAQEPLASGARVRVTAPDCALRGQAATFRALRADTLVLETTECPMASVTRLDVNRGRRSHTLLGAGIGFAAGALWGVVLCRRKAGHHCGVYGSDSDFTPLVAGVLGAGGGLVGGFAGYLIKTDRWEEVPLERLRVSLAPQRDGGFALAFSVRF